MEFTLSLEEVLKEPGLYTGEHFIKGAALEVTNNHDAWLVCYESPDDFRPSRERPPLSLGLVTQRYSRVFNRGQLFQNK